MRMYPGEILAVCAVFGFLWSIIPWNPLTAVDSCIAACGLLVVSVASVAYAKYLIQEVMHKIIPG